MAGELVVGYDGTDCAKLALSHAARLARRLGGQVVVAFAYGTSAIGGEVQDLSAAIAERGRVVTAEGVALAAQAGADARAELVDDYPAQALVRLAEALDAEMIVVGSYGEGPLKGAIVGSTPHKLIQLSTVPVLVVRA